MNSLFKSSTLKNFKFLSNSAYSKRKTSSLYKISQTKFSASNNNENNYGVEEPGFLEMVQMYFDGASKYIDIPKYYLNLIKTTKAAIKFNFPLVKDDGSIQVIQAYRAQHSLHYLPTKGGTRYADHIGKQ
jgi:glutamate dehydrogenase (NAD(P)+)